MTTLLRTPLFESYKKYGAKTIDFGGWDLPVQFSTIKNEHEAVRTKAGLFDVSHMGEIIVSGNNSLLFLQKMMTNDLSNLKVGDIQYTLMCKESGGIIDDLLIYKLAEETYMLVVNASNCKKDEMWLKQHQIDNVNIKNVSDDYALLAIQGPKSEEILQKAITNLELTSLKYFKFMKDVSLFNKTVLISRTGYTGEDGFEIYCNPNDAPEIWEQLLDFGSNDGLIPAGLGARDTLRFEAGLVLYGQEINEEINPFEVGLNFAVKLNKGTDFIGKKVLVNIKENGPKRKLVGIEMIDRGIPRHSYRIYSAGEEIGFITTGTQSPTLNKSVGMALIDIDFAQIDQEIEIEIRHKRPRAKIISIPLYKR